MHRSFQVLQGTPPAVPCRAWGALLWAWRCPSASEHQGRIHIPVSTVLYPITPSVWPAPSGDGRPRCQGPHRKGRLHAEAAAAQGSGPAGKGSHISAVARRPGRKVRANQADTAGRPARPPGGCPPAGPSHSSVPQGTRCHGGSGPPAPCGVCPSRWQNSPVLGIRSELRSPERASYSDTAPTPSGGNHV